MIPVSNNTSQFSACQVVTAGTPIGDGSAVPLPLSGFSGSERVETFNPNFGRQNSPVTFNGVTIHSFRVVGNSGAILITDNPATSRTSQTHPASLS